MKSAHQLAQEIANGSLTSEDLVRSCLNAVDKDNLKGRKLKAIISVRPEEQALEDARKRDEEVREGKRRGPLHGLPIVVKDAITTGSELGMPTTAGAEVIKAMKAKRNSAIVDKLIDAGLIILGKANLTEFCGLKDKTTPIGYSTVLGQTLSPFRQEGLEEKDQPHAGGSSVGSAVSIAAGFVPLAIGTETGGSNVFPASCNGVYGMTLTYGTVPVEGIWRISETFDKIGVMAADPGDLMLLANVIASTPIKDQEVRENKFKVGFVDVCWGGNTDEFKTKWEAQRENYDKVVDKLKSICNNVVYPLDLKVPSHLEYEGNSLFQIALWECNNAAKGFLTGFENGGVTDLEGMIQWNKDHAEIAMPEHHPGQSMLEDCISLRSSISPELRSKTITEIQRIAGPEGIDKVMQDNDIDIVISNSDSFLPCGLFIAARKGEESRLVRFMQAAKGVLGL